MEWHFRHIQLIQIYTKAVFPQTIIDLNALPESVMSYAEVADNYFPAETFIFLTSGPG